MGNVGEGAAVHQSRCVLQRLDEVGLDSVLQEGCHGSRGVKVICGHRLTLEIVGHDDPAQSLLQVSDIVRQTEDRHDLGGNSDDKVVLSDHAVGLSAKPDDDVPKAPVVHVQAPLPDNLSRIDAQLISLLDMVVQKGCQQIVGGGDGMEIPRKVQVQVLHGDYLGIAAPGRSPFDAEAGAKGGLPEGDDSLPPQLCHGLPQPHGGSRLPLSGGSGVDGCHKDQLPVLSVLDVLPELIGELCLVLSVEFQVLLRDADGGGHVPDVHHFCFLCDLNI